MIDDLTPARCNGSGSGFDDRLRVVELDVREIKTRMENLATRNWILGSTIAAIAVIITLGIQVLNMMSRILIEVVRGLQGTPPS